MTPLIMDPLIRMALTEDIGPGDVTSSLRGR